jgi:hypothetical protein
MSTLSWAISSQAIRALYRLMKKSAARAMLKCDMSLELRSFETSANENGAKEKGYGLRITGGGLDLIVLNVNPQQPGGPIVGGQLLEDVALFVAPEGIWVSKIDDLDMPSLWSLALHGYWTEPYDDSRGDHLDKVGSRQS